MSLAYNHHSTGKSCQSCRALQPSLSLHSAAVSARQGVGWREPLCPDCLEQFAPEQVLDARRDWPHPGRSRSSQRCLPGVDHCRKWPPSSATRLACVQCRWGLKIHWGLQERTLTCHSSLAELSRPLWRPKFRSWIQDERLDAHKYM